MEICEKIEATGLSIARAARLAGVPPTHLYMGRELSAQQRAALEGVIDDARAGKIRLRRGARPASRVPAHA